MTFSTWRHRWLRPLVALLVFGWACACATPITFSKPGTPPDEAARDRYACLQESRVGKIVGGQDAVYFYGQNQLAQREANRLFDACMGARGYRRE